MSHKKDSLWDRTFPFAFGEDCLWSSCPSCMTKSTDAKEVEQQREWGWRENGDAERMEMQRAWGCREHGDAERMGMQRGWGRRASFVSLDPAMADADTIPRLSNFMS